MRVVVKYRLSEVGRKAALIAGGDTDSHQECEVPQKSPEYAEVVQAGSFSGDRLVLDAASPLYSSGHSVAATEWDDVPTMKQVLEDHKRRLSKLEAINAEVASLRHEKTMAVLRGRKTKWRLKTVREGNDDTRWRKVDADWPRDFDAAVVESDEAKAWLAELEAGNAVAMAAALAKIAARRGNAAAQNCQPGQ